MDRPRRHPVLGFLAGLVVFLVSLAGSLWLALGGVFAVADLCALTYCPSPFQPNWTTAIASWGGSLLLLMGGAWLARRVYRSVIRPGVVSPSGVWTGWSSAAVVVCAGCRTENLARRRFCGRCGKPLPGRGPGRIA